MKKLLVLSAAVCCVLALAACTVKNLQESGDISQIPNPVHECTAEELTEETGIKYYLDENGDYCVPKRSVEELARSV